MKLAAVILYFVWSMTSGAALGSRMGPRFDWAAAAALSALNMLLGLVLFGKVFI